MNSISENSRLKKSITNISKCYKVIDGEDVIDSSEINYLEYASSLNYIYQAVKNGEIGFSEVYQKITCKSVN